MRLYYDDISVKNRLLIEKGYIACNKTGLIHICGKNGVGKTLLLNNIFFNCIKKDINVKMVDQKNFEIITNLTIKENITLCDEEKNVIFQNSEKLKGLFARESKNLSGGEKRLVSLLRGFSADADVLILDEPTNDLDHDNVLLLLEIIKNIKETSLIIVVSHDDRIKDIADMEYAVVDSRVVSISEKSCMCEVSENVDEKKDNKKISRLLYDKIFRKKFLLIIPVVFMFIVSIYLMQELSLKDIVQIDKIEDNRIDMYIPIVSTFNMQNIGAIPGVALNGAMENNDIKYQDIVDGINEEVNHIFFNLKMQSTDNYDVYPMEYYMLSSKETIYSLDRYVEKDGEKNIFEYYVDISELFEYSTESSDPSCMEAIVFDEMVFQEVIEDIEQMYSEDNLKVIHTVIMLKEGYTFWEFVQEAEFERFTQGGMYIRSNETIELINQLNEVERYSSILKNFIITCIIAIIIEIIMIFMCLIFDEHKIYILRNYGVNQEEVAENIFERIKNLSLKMLIWLVGTIVLVVFSISIKRLFILAIIFALLICLQIIIINFISKWMIKKYCNVVYNWRYR